MVAIKKEELGRVQELYYRKSMSAREIAVEFHVGIHAVYAFMRRHNLQRRERPDSNKASFERKPSTFNLIEQLSHDQQRLKDIAVTLYWGEGAKRGTVVDFANSDVDTCIIFIRFLREICQVNEKKLRGFLYCHANQNTEALIRFWARTLQLPRQQFTKPYVRQSVNFDGLKQKQSSHRMEYGLIHIRYGDAKLLRKIIEWIVEIRETNMGRYRSGQTGQTVKRQPFVETRE